jgi:hypothetical protein
MSKLGKSAVYGQNPAWMNLFANVLKIDPFELNS